MKANIFLSTTVIKRIENVRVQLFNKKFYKLNKGYAVQQIPFYAEGNLQYEDFGQPIPTDSLFKQIKLMFDKQNKVIAVRIMQGEPLQAVPTSIWARNKEKKSVTQ